VVHGFPGAVDDAPEDDVEHPAHVRGRHLPGLTEDGHGGVVDPGVEVAERPDRGVGDALDVVLVGHVGDDRDGLAPAAVDLVAELLQRVLVAGSQDQAGTPLGGAPGSGQADAAGGSGEDDDLLVEWAETNGHGALPGVVAGSTPAPGRSRLGAGVLLPSGRGGDTRRGRVPSPEDS
jgi:hypothetical protein